MNWNERSREVEEMDDLDMSGERLEQTLKDLSKVHRWLGGHQLSSQLLDKLWQRDKSIQRIVDFGCGGGDSLFSMYDWSQKKGRDIQFKGMDANASIVHYAQEKAGKRAIEFHQGDIFSKENIQACSPADVALFSLFLHHFSEEEIQDIFKSCSNLGIRYIVITDLQRSKWAYRLFKLATKLVSFSEMAREDGLLSIQKGFHREELKELLANSPYCNIHDLKWKWAFRYVVIAELEGR